MGDLPPNEHSSLRLMRRSYGPKPEPRKRCSSLPGHATPRRTNLRMVASREPEPVKSIETPGWWVQARGTSFSGRLIQTSVGTGLGNGRPLTKRSGWAA